MDRISDSILPGVTVFTTRIRYLSFLAWALQKESGREASIDRWDVALSIGEHLRHQTQGDCRYLGVRLLKQRAPENSARLPLRLHSPPVRLRYSGLLRSCGFSDGRNLLTDRGKALAECFDRDTPNSLPKAVRYCSRMPCLSEVSGRELKRLKAGLLQDTYDATSRCETFRELRSNLLRDSRSIGPHVVLRKYLREPGESRTAQAIRQAAILELEALPLNRLFQFLYRHGGNDLKGRLPKPRRLANPYEIPSSEEDRKGFLEAIVTHLLSDNYSFPAATIKTFQ